MSCSLPLPRKLVQKHMPMNLTATRIISGRLSFPSIFLLWAQTGFRYLFSLIEHMDETNLTILQGAYVYTLYKDEKGLAESVVAALFTSGFLAAAISALFVGKLADRYGRRLACLIFCGTYAVSCLTKISNDVIILFIGRLL